MRWKRVTYIALFACALLAGLSAAADDNKNKPALAGVWVRPGGEPKIEFTAKNVMKIAPHGDQTAIVVVCEYRTDKEGRVKAKVTDYEGDEELKAKIKKHAPLGLEFNFKWQVKDDAATLDDLKGDNVEALKTHLEGKFDKK
jgi:hypothetical protein